MLEQLVKKDKYWRIVAFRICKDKMLSDDIVQEMYLKLYNNTKEINDFYVIIVMRNIFLDIVKQNKQFVDIENYEFKDSSKPFEIDDNEKEFLDSLKWYEKELIEMTHDKSCRQIQKDLNIHHKFIERILKKAKTQWQEKKQKD